jgi:hypothetical protein
MQDEKTLIQNGNAAAKLLKDKSFNKVLNVMVEHLFSNFVNGTPEAKEARDSVYYQHRALHDIVGTMQQMVAVRDEINQKNESK